ncbi:uncharacterized protein [Ptychodera flava]|uniref:uncharacterized protein isoform X2 n=1 Tax=Ptychodera flava TaxID=63121 RepID=UPI00396A8D7B
MEEAEAIPHDMRLPSSCQFMASSVEDNKVGVWSREDILEGTTFGPYAGEKKKVSDDCDPYYSWEIKGPKGRRLFCIDASNPKKSNWMRYIKCARYYEEQNMVAMQHQKEIYYKTIKDVHANEELLCWYNIPAESEAGGLGLGDTPGTQTLCQGHPTEVKVKKKGRKRRKKRRSTLSKKPKDSQTTNTPKRTTTTSLKSRRSILDQETGATGIGRRTRSRGPVLDMSSEEEQKSSSDEESTEVSDSEGENELIDKEDGERSHHTEQVENNSLEIKIKTDSTPGDFSASNIKTAVVKIKDIRINQSKDDVGLSSGDCGDAAEDCSSSAVPYENMELEEMKFHGVSDDAANDTCLSREAEVDDLPELDKNSDTGDTVTERSGKLDACEDIGMPVLERVAADFSGCSVKQHSSDNENQVLKTTPEEMPVGSTFTDAADQEKQTMEKEETPESVVSKEIEVQLASDMSGQLSHKDEEEQNHFVKEEPSGGARVEFMNKKPNENLGGGTDISTSEKVADGVDKVTMDNSNIVVSLTAYEQPKHQADTVNLTSTCNSGETAAEERTNILSPVYQEPMDITLCGATKSASPMLKYAGNDSKSEVEVKNYEISANVCQDILGAREIGSSEGHSSHAEEECGTEQDIMRSGGASTSPGRESVQEEIIEDVAPSSDAASITKPQHIKSDLQSVRDHTDTINLSLPRADDADRKTPQICKEANVFNAEKSQTSTYVSSEDSIRVAANTENEALTHTQNDVSVVLSATTLDEQPVDLTANTDSQHPVEVIASSLQVETAVPHSTVSSKESNQQQLQSAGEDGVDLTNKGDQGHAECVAASVTDQVKEVDGVHINAATNATAEDQSQLASESHIIEDTDYMDQTSEPINSSAVTAKPEDLSSKAASAEPEDVEMRSEGHAEEPVTNDSMTVDSETSLATQESDNRLMGPYEDTNAADCGRSQETSDAVSQSAVTGADVNISQEIFSEEPNESLMEQDVCSVSQASASEKYNSSFPDAADSDVFSEVQISLQKKSSDLHSADGKATSSEDTEVLNALNKTNGAGGELEIAQTSEDVSGSGTHDQATEMTEDSNSLVIDEKIDDLVSSEHQQCQSEKQEIMDAEQSDTKTASDEGITESSPTSDINLPTIHPMSQENEISNETEDKDSDEVALQNDSLEMLDTRQAQSSTDNSCASEDSSLKSDSREGNVEDMIGEENLYESASNDNNNEDDSRKCDSNNDTLKISDWAALYSQKVFLPPQLDASGQPIIYSDFRQFKYDIKSDHLVRGKRRKTLFKCKLCPCTVEYPHSLKRHYFVHHVEDKYKRIPSIVKTTKVVHQRERIRTRGASQKEERRRRESLLEEENEDDRDTSYTSQVHDKMGFKIRSPIETDANEGVQSSSEKDDDEIVQDPNVALEEDFENSEQNGDNKPLYPCKLCGKLLKSPKRLANHMLSHPKQAALNCHKCSRQFIYKQSLERHLLTHSGVKPYSCGHCGKRFGSSTNAKRHERLHLGYKAHRCDQCDITFIQNTDLQRHIQNNHSSNKGMKPKKRRRRRGTKFVKAKVRRNKHMVASATFQGSSMPLKPPGEDHMCPWCGRIFKSQTSMKKHIGHIHKKKHKQMMEPESNHETWDDSVYDEEGHTPEYYIETNDLKDTVPDSLSKYLDGKIQTDPSEEVEKPEEEGAKLVIGTNTTNVSSVHTVVVPTYPLVPKTVPSPIQEQADKMEVQMPVSSTTISSDADSTTAIATDSSTVETPISPKIHSQKVTNTSAGVSDVTFSKTMSVGRSAKMKYTPTIKDHAQRIPQHTPRTVVGSRQTTTVQGSPSSTGKPVFARSQVKMTGLMNSATVKSSLPKGSDVPDNFTVQKPSPYTRPPFGASSAPKDFSPTLARKNRIPPQKITPVQQQQQKVLPQKSPVSSPSTQPNQACKSSSSQLQTSNVMNAPSSKLTVLANPGQAPQPRSSMAHSLTVPPRLLQANRALSLPQPHYTRAPTVRTHPRVGVKTTTPRVVSPSATMSNVITRPPMNSVLVQTPGGIVAIDQSKIVSSMAQGGSNIPHQVQSIAAIATGVNTMSLATAIPPGRFIAPVRFQPPPQESNAGTGLTAVDGSMKNTTTIKHVLPATQISPHGSTINTSTIVRQVNQPAQVSPSSQQRGIVSNPPAVTHQVQQPSSPLISIPAARSIPRTSTAVFNPHQQMPTARPQHRPMFVGSQAVSHTVPSNVRQKPLAQPVRKKPGDKLAAAIQNIRVRANNPQLTQSGLHVSPISKPSNVGQNPVSTIQRSPVLVSSSAQSGNPISVPVIIPNVVNTSVSSPGIRDTRQPVPNQVGVATQPVPMIARSLQSTVPPISVPRLYSGRVPSGVQGQNKRPASESYMVVNLSAKRLKSSENISQDAIRQQQEGSRQSATQSSTANTGQVLDLTGGRSNISTAVSNTTQYAGANRSEGLFARAGGTLTKTQQAGGSLGNQVSSSSLQLLNTYSQSRPGELVTPWQTKASRGEHHAGSQPSMNAKQITCSVCRVLFHSLQDLSHHIEVHAPEWPFKCEICYVLFKDANVLMEHRFRIHGIKQTYTCSVCHIEFNHMELLRRHQISTHPNVNCSYLQPGQRMKVSHNQTW